MAHQILATRQRAFTWTGPYGGGKSSLALLLCSLVGPDEQLRDKAREILDLSGDDRILSAFAAKDRGWTVLPVVGKRGSVVESLSTALKAARGNRRGPHYGADMLIEQLLQTAQQSDRGVLVVIDELGKFLEAAASGDGDDINFFQDLAERASRCDGKLIVVGILHQAFDSYASRLSRQIREDWNKVQGRFVDVPLISATDEVLELVSRAIDVPPQVDRAIDYCVAEVASAIRERRTAAPASLERNLSGCWPLHPVTTALLGPVSRRRFGQNERSTFGFLASREPFGFVDFLEESPIRADSMYEPARYWDYLRANFEPAILASPDGHRWSAAVDAVERSAAKGESLHINVTKTVALIELFSAGSGLVAEDRILCISIRGAKHKDDIRKALNDLVHWNVLIERRHLNAFGVFAGSDFDIESAIAHARSELSNGVVEQASALADLQPVVAKRLYAETGTLRWFSRRIVQVSGLSQTLSNHQPDPGSAGTFILCLPDEPGQDVQGQIKWHVEMCKTGQVLLGAPSNSARIFEVAMDLTAAQRVLKTRAELEGDAVARREVNSRVSLLQGMLEEELTEAQAKSTWLWPGGPKRDLQGSPSTMASKVAEWLYPDAPRIFSELINRESPSSNASKARRDLLYRMIQFGDRECLGYEGYPADAGLYHTVLRMQGLHRPDGDSGWGFRNPNLAGGEHHQAMLPLWNEAQRRVLGDDRQLTVKELHDLWAARPYGVRSGLLPILSLAFYLAHRSELALYIEGVFTPGLSESVVDEWLRAPQTVRLQHVAATKDRTAFLHAIRDSLGRHISATAGDTPLDAARALVGMVLTLPMWSRRTMTISREAQDVRGLLLKANDPHKVLFADLPTLLRAETATVLAGKLGAVLLELQEAYPAMLERVRRHMLAALDQADGNATIIRARATSVKGVSGDLRLESLLSHLERYDESRQVVEGLISSAISKPSAAWVDRDIDQALLQLSTFAHEFRKAEVLAPYVRGVATTRHMIGVVFASSGGQRASESVDISDSDLSKVRGLADRLLKASQSERREVVLAALAEVGVRLVRDSETEKVNG
jgi:hypothetical protein